MAVEGLLTWSWVADWWAREGLAFALGHALPMKALHGGKAHNDPIDAPTMAVLLRGGMPPQAYGYPAAVRATRALLRRRMSRMRQCAALLPHVQQANGQDTLPERGTNIAYEADRAGVAERVPAPAPRKVSRWISRRVGTTTSCSPGVRARSSTWLRSTMGRSSTACARSRRAASAWPWGRSLQCTTCSAGPGGKRGSPIAAS